MMNPSLGLSHRFFLMDRKQLLSVSLVRYEEGLLVPIFVLLQQPSFVLKYTYDANPKAFAIVLKENTKESSKKLSTLSSPLDGDRIITDAVPVSFRLPSGYEVDAHGSQEPNNTRNMALVKMKVQVVDHLHQLSRFERQQNWYMQVRTRPITGQKDKFYVHLQSDIQCRSLVEVHYFIVEGKHPRSCHSRAMKEELNKSDGVSKRKTGKSLVEKKEVGLYDHDNRFFYRWQAKPTESLPGASQSGEISGNRKRKREEDISVQSGQIYQIADSEPKLYPLYDFLLM